MKSTRTTHTAPDLPTFMSNFSPFKFIKNVGESFTECRHGDCLLRSNATLRVANSVINLFYSVGTATQIGVRFAGRSFACLSTYLPHAAILYSSIEAIRSCLLIHKVKKIKKELEIIKSKNGLIKKSDLIENETPKYKDLLSGDILEKIKKKGDDVDLSELMDKQVKKAYLIHTISIVCLGLSIAAVVAGLVLAPPVTILALLVIGGVVTTARNLAIGGYLFQEGHTFSLKAGFKYQVAPIVNTYRSLKNTTSSIIQKCTGCFSCCFPCWTSRQRLD